MQTTTLLDAIETNKIDSALVVEEEMRKKHEQKNDFSHIEMNLDNGIQKINVPNYGIFLMENSMGEHFRVFPISNWTEMDVWQYIIREKLKFHHYISHMNVKWCGEMVLGFLFLNF